MSATRLLIPVQKCRLGDGAFRWPSMVVLASARSVDSLPLGQLAADLAIQVSPSIPERIRIPLNNDIVQRLIASQNELKLSIVLIIVRKIHFFIFLRKTLHVDDSIGSIA